MRVYFILAVLCLSSLKVLSQKLELEKASPFTAVQWEKELPKVQFENEWYHFEALDHFSRKEILDFCKKEFGKKWQKRFAEDLVEVLQGLDYQPNKEVRLQLAKNGISKVYTGTFTFENRQRTLQFNNDLKVSQAMSEGPHMISIEKALSDLKQFEDILESRSSYALLSTFDYKGAIKEVASALSTKKADIDVNVLTVEFSKIMSEIGDRHSSIKNESFNKNGHPTYNLKLPFGVTSLDGHFVATQQHLDDTKYTYYDPSYPRILSIDGVAIETLINDYNYRAKKAPPAAKNSRGTRAIQNYGALMFKNNMKCPDRVTVIFGNGISEKTEIVPLTTTKKGYASKLSIANYANSIQLEKGNFDGLNRILEGTIGYINIPSMSHYDEVEGLEKFIEETLHSFLETKALIVDVRNNPGGGREILQTFANYIVQPAQSPWVANVAYLRTDAMITGDVSSMSSRYLYSYNSEKLTNVDRKAIDHFNKNFKLQRSFDTSKFSHPFYMVLHNGTKPYTKPVYILVNERSFSAATVFTSAFKGLPNVKIVGVTTDGSSGNSKVFNLKHSSIRVKVSTMLSFQRNGNTLDGNGTVPDIVLSEDEAQILQGVDNQLDDLIEMINK